MAELKPIIEQSMTQYAGAVLQSRALVDVRDCLKPSARQIFFCMDKYKYKILSDLIVHTHAKDGIVTDTTKHGWLEVPLGQGGVDWDNYLAALNKIGYTGYLTIERECGEDPAADIKMAVDFLGAKLANLGIALDK